MLKATAITFDIDWAPDWAIALCDDLCRRAGARATYFITHQSDILADLRKASDRIELGIHPNFLPKSSHGADIRTVLETCLQRVPEAVSMRTHALVQSTPIFAAIADHTPIEADVSLLLPLHADLQPTEWFAGDSLRRIVRLPYFWEDDVMAAWPGWKWTNGPCRTDGLAIYDFHPVHVALNTERMDRYVALKAFIGDRPLSSLTQVECEKFLNRGEGARDFLERLLTGSPSGSFHTISGIAKRYQEDHS